MSKRKLLTVGLVAALVATAAAANLVTTHAGLLPVGFGLLVPAGTFFAGLALALRDGLQETAGLRTVVGAILAGALVSFLTADVRIALASGVAFLIAELVDLYIYTPLRRKGWRRALALSNACAAVVDTLLFLGLAGFPLTTSTIGGQLVVKALFVPVLAIAAVDAATRVRKRVRT